MAPEIAQRFLVETPIEAGASSLAARLGARRALAGHIGRGLGKAGSLLFGILTADELRLVGNPARFQLLLIAEGKESTGNIEIRSNQAVLPILAADLGNEMNRPGIWMEIRRQPRVDPLSPSLGVNQVDLVTPWPMVDKTDLVTETEGTRHIFGGSVGGRQGSGRSLARFIVVPNQPLQFTEPGRYEVTIGGQAKARAIITVVPGTTPRPTPIAAIAPVLLNAVRRGTVVRERDAGMFFFYLAVREGDRIFLGSMGGIREPAGTCVESGFFEGWDIEIAGPLELSPDGSKSFEQGTLTCKKLPK